MVYLAQYLPSKQKEGFLHPTAVLLSLSTKSRYKNQLDTSSAYSPFCAIRGTRFVLAKLIQENQEAWSVQANYIGQPVCTQSEVALQSMLLKGVQIMPEELSEAAVWQSTHQFGKKLRLNTPQLCIDQSASYLDRLHLHLALSKCAGI